MSDDREERDEREEREDREDRGFKVDDRRRFETDGSTRTGTDEDPARRPATGAPAATAPTAAPPLPEIDFSTFVLSLTTSAMVHLGEAPHPEGGQQLELTLAKQTIDILGMLREKTQGNLSADEAQLLDEVLYDLRLRFVGVATR